VIPAYNVERYVADTIRSVLAQTYRDFEVIVVDDGSSDGTAAVLDSFGDKIHVVQQQNRGVAAARNTGLRHTTGELIAFLDADDLWLPRRLERMVDFLDVRPRIGFATSDAFLRYEDVPSAETYYRDLVPCPRLPRPQPYWIIQHNFVFTMVVLRRNVLERHGCFDENLTTAEDWDLWMRFILGGEELGLLNEPLGYYRIRKTGLTLSDREQWERNLSTVPARALHHPAVQRTPGVGRDLLLPAARRAMKARENEQAAGLFRAAARDPLLPLGSRIRVRAAALSPRLARGLWSELVLRRGTDGSFVDTRHRVYRVVPEALDGFHEATHFERTTVSFTGWATDASHEKPADHIAVFDGPHFVAAGRVDRPRPDVARHFANARLTMCGFQIDIPRDQISRPENLRVYAVAQRAVGPLPGLPPLES
jgi:glycosyltransferase involved in cell wall biosynthesis